eukprot:TRINITY_DN40251_c0_g1_i1.p1 TRINITY_DN40251_c0_g1~~TRINITY_DN40251_c0_g1_i1.p1  ORF type:complete len:315 (+),score=104.22 TRINITY_DN40251_c0_g1_i1:51-947(+)
MPRPTRPLRGAGGDDDDSVEGLIEVDSAGHVRKATLHEYDARNLKNDESIRKYYAQRYRLWSLFDRGVRMDRESWFSVTPEAVASHIARRCRLCSHDVVVDAFCGAGGCAIQLATVAKRVIAVDVDPLKISMAQHNAAIYGVGDKIDFIVGDFVALLPHLEADIVLLAPPWGGPDYASGSFFDVRSMRLSGLDGEELLRLTRRHITPNVAYHLPRTVLAEQLTMLAESGETVELEHNIFNRKVKTVTAYYGDLVADGKAGRVAYNPPLPFCPDVPIDRPLMELSQCVHRHAMKRRRVE